MPEVFLKCVTLVRNLGHELEDITTANFDFIQSYRPLTNVVRRPTADGAGRGFAITGHHELTIPLLAAELISWSRGRVATLGAQSVRTPPACIEAYSRGTRTEVRPLKHAGGVRTAMPRGIIAVLIKTRETKEFVPRNRHHPMSASRLGTLQAALC